MISEQNSQEEEGFITAKLVQKVQQVEEIRDSQGKECKPFSALCMSAGQGPLRLQLPESLEPFDSFEIEQDPQPAEQSFDSNMRTKPMSRNNSLTSAAQHPYRIYMHNPAYQLVYSRSSSQEPIVNEFQYIRNEVVLQTAQKSLDGQCEFEKKGEVVNKLRNPYSRLLRSFDYTLVRENARSQAQIQQSIKSSSQMLVFDSRFQSGNLYCAYNKIGTNEYHLFIQNDTNSYGYNQWFYFSLSNIKKDTQYSFVIVNFKKKHSFFKYGYKPMIFSLKKYQKNNNQNGWYRGGYNVDYFESHIITSKFFRFYKLIFTLKFNYDNDYASIAANLPYSFTRLSNYLERFTKQFNISSSSQQIANLKVSGLGRTFCGNNLPEIKINPTEEEVDIRKSKSPNKNKKKPNKEKKMLIFMARQHPGQTVSSFLMESILQQLSTFGYQTQNQKQKADKQRTKYLVKNYTIVIFPMINIDGVIYGNSRCDITGMDMNRRWKNPSKVFHPQLVNIKKKIQSYARKYEIVGCFDLHGHSKLYNVFCYSCKINPISCRILPYIISKETSKFNFPSCTFGITRQKSTTARAAMFKIIENQNVLTIQSSYFGYTDESVIKKDSKGHSLKLSQQNTQRQKKVIKYFQPKTFVQIAKGIINGLQIFLNQSKMYSQVQNEIKSQIDELLHLEKINEQNQASGSESDPEGDQIDFQTKINTILSKQFVQQATSFMPAQQQNIEIYAASDSLTPQYRANQTFNLKNLKTEQKQEHDWKLNDSVQKIEKVNKIRITKMKPDISDRKTLSSQKLENQKNPILQQKSKPVVRPRVTKKQTISYSFHKNFNQSPDEMSPQKKFNSTHHQKQPNSSERLYSQSNNRVSFGIKKKQDINGLNQTIEGHAKFPAPAKDYECGDLIIISADRKQIIKDEKSNLLQRSTFNPYVQMGQNDFFLKFQRFFPSQAVQSSAIKKQKLSFLQQSIYKDDQRQILNTLMQNKRRLDRQKMQRQIQKSNMSIKEKQNVNSKKKYNPWREEKEVSDKTISGMLATNGRKKHDIVDFKTFKDRDKLKMHIRQANLAYTKYMKKDLG